MEITISCYIICICFPFLIPLSFQAAPVNIIVGSHVWVEDPTEAWVDGEVSRITGEEVHVHTTNGKMVS